MKSNFTKQLDYHIEKSDVGIQKINSSQLEMFGIVITSFSIDDKDRICRFFEKSFLLAKISIGIVFGISFLTLNKVQIDFNNERLI